jgi:hypothetical protein
MARLINALYMPLIILFKLTLGQFIILFNLGGQFRRKIVDCPRTIGSWPRTIGYCPRTIIVRGQLSVVRCPPKQQDPPIHIDTPSLYAK